MPCRERVVATSLSDIRSTSTTDKILVILSFIDLTHSPKDPSFPASSVRTSVVNINLLRLQLISLRSLVRKGPGTWPGISKPVRDSSLSIGIHNLNNLHSAVHQHLLSCWTVHAGKVDLAACLDQLEAYVP